MVSGGGTIHTGAEMYYITVEDHFDAAHYLRNYRGKCENVHGHRFKVEVTLSAATLNEIGLAYDFTTLKQHLKEIVASFDHCCINDSPPFDSINPSSENIARTIFERLVPYLPGDVVLTGVEIWESPQSHARYCP